MKEIVSLVEIKGLRILITGATGYIGGKMALRLYSLGSSVICMTRGNKKVDSIPVVNGDLLKPETLKHACENIDIVCHFAGALGRGLTDEIIRTVNVNGTRNMITAAKKMGVRYFLHISSGAVVGPRGPTLADETTECRPYTVYEQSKYEGERSALSVAYKIGLSLGVVRPSFTYGPGDPHKLLMFKLIKKRLFFFIGDGLSTNHPVYIEDLIDGIILMLKKRPIQEVYILGGPRPVSKKEWANTIAKALDVKTPNLCIPTSLAWKVACIMEPVGRLIGMEFPLTRSRILAMSRYWGMDISKARRELGYEPRVDLDEGVAKTVEWYLKEGYL
ncbi:MAG: NAD-dependent epimerase/dehydratase family protein [Deltaproteobacteria bacterium]|nr:NAD-dependent epimerase/dehydratase family protein [Deltaproteobacteria bacterium]